MKARFVTLALALFVLLPMGAHAYTGSHPKMQIRVAWPDTDQLAAVRAIDDLDPMKITPGEELILVSHPDQIAALEALGLVVEVLIPDMEEYYASQREGYRNFGDLYTYDEMIIHLDEIHAQYPEITTARFSIGQSHEGRDLWAIKISDNPGLDEDEPEVLFDALHHAREPITVNVLIETLWYLCENYGVDDDATFLVNNRETWFVPVVNPDGYVYNEQTYPSGGGMWRKNRRAPTGGCWGVDLNRNYPYEWGGVGSSSDPCSDTYHGPSPGSEPCIQAMLAFHLSREFVTHDTYHSVAGMILFPWSYTNAHTQHDAEFRALAAGMQTYCGYQTGQPGEILYNCSGTTFDWTYAELGTFSFCTEVDGSGFWPSNSEVPGLVAENLPKNLYLMRQAGCHLGLGELTLTGGNGDDKPDPGETLELVVTIENGGVIADAENVAVTLVTHDPYIQLHVASAAIGDLGPGASGTNAGAPFSFTVEPTCPEGHLLEIEVAITATAFAMAPTHQWIVGDLPIVFVDDMESGAGDWTHAVITGGFTDQWHQSASRNHTAGGAMSWKFGDSGGGDYASLADGALTTPPFPVGSVTRIDFWHWMDAEESGAFPGRAYDGGLIELSIDGGPWEQVTTAAGYTHTIREGGTPGPFIEGTPVFSGAFDWQSDQLMLSGLQGEAQLRFRFGSDGADVHEGWHVDDIEIAGTSGDNLPPSAPGLVSPGIGATVNLPELIVENAIDPNPGDDLTYGFRVYSDALLTDLMHAVDGLPEGTGMTAYMAPLGDGTYYWVAYAFDGTECGRCMDAGWFILQGAQSAGEPIMATGLRLMGAFPNPVANATALRFEIGTAGLVRGRVIDLEGRCVRTLAGTYPAGPNALVWNGRDDRGARVPAGVYLYSLKGGELAREGRLLVVR